MTTAIEHKAVLDLTDLPDRLRRDADVLCGGMQAALAAACDCLARMGDPAVIADLCA